MLTNYLDFHFIESTFLPPLHLNTASTHTKQQAIKGPKINYSNGKTCNGLINIKNEKPETRVNQTTTTRTEHPIPDLGQVQTIVAGLNVLIGTNLHPYPKQ